MTVTATSIRRARSASTTPKQRAVLAAILDLTAERGYPPTMREIAAVIGSIHSDVQQKLWRLRRDGRVTWDEGRARTVRVVEVTQ